jgi:hypothetical protein
MPSTTIYEFNYYMNLTKVNYQISPYCHSADPVALRTPYTQPTTLNWYGASVGGTKYYAVNLILRLFCTIFLHSMSS